MIYLLESDSNDDSSEIGSVDHGVGRVHVDTTDAGAFRNSDFDVAVQAPVRSPRISHEEVLLAVLCAEADGDNAMVEVGSAPAGDHSASVICEHV